jgi:hypothetical protein
MNRLYSEPAPRTALQNGGLRRSKKKLHSNHCLAAVFYLRCQGWTSYSVKSGVRQEKSSLRAAYGRAAERREPFVRTPWQQFVAAGKNVLEQAKEAARGLLQSQCAKNVLMRAVTSGWSSNTGCCMSGNMCDPCPCACDPQFNRAQPLLR